jgi:hypothetical protein
LVIFAASLTKNNSKMKKLMLSAAIVGFVAVGFTSCKKAECVECSGVATICEEDYTSVGGMSWKTWSDNMAAQPGCKKVSK